MKILMVVCLLATGGLAYLPPAKESLLQDLFLQEIAGHLGRELTDPSYIDDYPEGRLALGARSLGRDLEEEQYIPIDYDTSLADSSLQPSIRDQEFLQHSSLWGSQYVSGGAGEGKQMLHPEGVFANKQEIKTDATLPAYCNPPNPCPLGYNGEQGCLEEFENTASFSRRYQASQDCMCDNEHMFDCPNPVASAGDDSPLGGLSDLDFNTFLQHTMHIDPGLQHKSLVAKKYHQKKSVENNPYLSGERLPVAAKKGFQILH